ncbi:hypothetical protein [Streptomyces sp. NPDC002932]|uniref:hypothetical protein n=1 Tax=Streptomyces sp. NPDC002932 TaxID=3364672 RepID=UPI00367C7E3F
MAPIRYCANCDVRLPLRTSARRRYCDDACRSQAYRRRVAADRSWQLGMMLAEAEHFGDRRMIRLLTCPECGMITFAGAGFRIDKRYCCDRCRSRAYRRRAARQARRAVA